MRLIFIAFLFFLSFDAFSQTRADTLDVEVQALGDCVEKMEKLNELLKLRYSTTPDKAIEYGIQALGIAERLDSLEWVSKMTNNVGIICYLQGKYDESVVYYEKALNLDSLKGDKVGMATTQGNIANVYRAKGDYEKAVSYNERSLGIFKGLDDSIAVARIHNNIANIHNDQGNYSGALENFMISLKIYEKYKDEKEVARLYSNVATVYYNQKLLAEALESFKKAYTIQNKLKDLFGKATSLSNMGNVYHEKEENAEALKVHKEALEIRKITDDKPGQAESMMHIAQEYESLQQYDLAESFFKEALKLNKEIGHKRNTILSYLAIGRFNIKNKNYREAIKNLREGESLGREADAKRELENIYRSLADAYAQEGNYAKAYKLHLQYSDLHDSIYTSESSEQLREMQTKYKTEKMEQKAALQEQQAELQDLQIRRQKQARNVLVGGLGLVALLLVVSVRSYLQKRRDNELMTVQQKKIQEDNVVLIEQKGKIEHQLEKIEEQKQHITDSITYASRIQAALLPPEELLNEELPEHFVYWRPRDIVSGDFYWMRMVDGKVLVAAADCTGHGVPGAFMSMLGIAFLNEIVANNTQISAGEILTQLRELVKSSLRQTKGGSSKDGMDMGLCIIDQENMKIQFAGAYNPLYIIRDGNLEKIKADRMPIGIYVREKPTFMDNDIEIQHGDQLYMFSDGYVDQFGGPEDKKFRPKNFQELLLKNAHLPMKEQEAVLADTMAEWKGDVKQMDDMLVIGIKV